MSGPLRGQVLRDQLEGVREDAVASCTESSCWRGCARRRRHVWDVRMPVSVLEHAAAGGQCETMLTKQCKLLHGRHWVEKKGALLEHPQNMIWDRLYNT